MELLEKLRGKVDSGEVIYVEKMSRSVEFKGWKIRGSESAQERGYAVRVVVDGKIGTAATTDVSAIDRMLENAIQAAQFGEKLDLVFPSKAEHYESPDIFDNRLADTGINTLADMGKELVAQLEKYRDDCDSEIGVSTSQSKLRIANTNGFDQEYRKSSFSLSGYLTRVKENDIYMAWDYFVSTHFPEDNGKAVNPIVEKIDDVMQYADTIVPAPTGRIPVIFDPHGAMVLLYPLSMGINGNNIYTRTSPVCDKLGQTLFDKKLTVVDDGTMDRRSSSAPFDSEGIPKRKLPLVEKGVLKNFVFDLTTAKKAGYESNGCASRSLFSPPSPGTSNIVIEGGANSYSDILADIKEGIIVESVLGMGQGNILSGAFSNPIATGFKIENGKIVGRVKNLAIAGNVYDNLKDITAISSDRKWIYGSYLIPYLRLDNISVVGK